MRLPLLGRQQLGAVRHGAPRRRIEAGFHVIAAVGGADQQHLAGPRPGVRLLGDPRPAVRRPVEPPDGAVPRERDDLADRDAATVLGNGNPDLEAGRAIVARRPRRPGDFGVQVFGVSHVGGDVHVDAGRIGRGVEEAVKVSPTDHRDLASAVRDIAGRQVFDGQLVAFELAQLAQGRVDVLPLIGEWVRRRDPPDLGVGIEQAAAVAKADSLGERRPRCGLGHQHGGVQVEARLDDLGGDDDPAAGLTGLAEDGGQPLSALNAAKLSVQQRAVPDVGPQMPIEALGGADRVHHDEGEPAQPVALQRSGRYRLVVTRVGGQTSHRAESS